MTIRVRCPNGHQLKAKDSHAGRTLTCPSCGQAIKVPNVEAEQAVNPFTFNEKDFMSQAMVSTPQDANSAFFGLPDTAESSQLPTWNPENHFSEMQRVSRNEASPSANSSVHATNKSRIVKPAEGAALGGAGFGGWQNLDRASMMIIGGGLLGGMVAGLLTIAVVWLFVKSDVTDPLTMTASTTPEGTSLSMEMTSAIVPKIYEDPKENLDKIVEQLEQIGLAWLNYESARRTFAPPDNTGLSWRVHLLPYMGHMPLYEKFHLDEPWNSPHNRSLIDLMPNQYRIGGNAGGSTRIQVPVGDNLLFSKVEKPKFSSITDGLKNTILALVVGKSKEIPWTKPDELDFTPTAPFDSLGNLPDTYICVIASDGKAAILPPDISAEEFYALLTPRGNDVADIKGLSARFSEIRETWTSTVTAASGEAQASKGKPTPSSPNFETEKVRNDRLKQLREIGMAGLNFQSAFKRYPVPKQPQLFDAEGRPHLSWRVHLLPFIDQKPLYDLFKFDEPWDSPHNILLLDKMPEIYRDPLAPRKSNKTRIVRFTGPGTPFMETGAGPTYSDFTDHSSETIILICAGSDKAVPWTKPYDLPFDQNAPLQSVGKLDSPLIHCVLGNNNAVSLDATISPEIFKAIVSSNGGEIIPPKDRPNGLR